MALSRDVVELKGDDATLRKLLIELSQSGSNGINFIDPKSGDMYGPFMVRLNGEIHRFLPNGLNTKLREGDHVQITMVMASGG